MKNTKKQSLMPKLKFVDQSEEYDLNEDSSIAEACEEAGVPFACTEGVCGTCVVEVKSGMENLSEFTEEEQDFLGDLDCEPCQCKIKNGDAPLFKL